MSQENVQGRLGARTRSMARHAAMLEERRVLLSELVATGHHFHTAEIVHIMTLVLEPISDMADANFYMKAVPSPSADNLLVTISAGIIQPNTVALADPLEDVGDGQATVQIIDTALALLGETNRGATGNTIRDFFLLARRMVENGMNLGGIVQTIYDFLSLTVPPQQA